MMVPTWTETCWSGFYKFNWFLTTQRFCIIECIIWTIKHLILLLHGVTMTIIPNITVNQKLPYYWSQMPSQIPQKQTIYPVFLWIVYQHKFWLYIFYSIFLLLTNSMWNTHRFYVTITSLLTYTLIFLSTFSLKLVVVLFLCRYRTFSDFPSRTNCLW